MPEMMDRADILQLIKVYAREHPEILTASGIADLGQVLKDHYRCK